MCLDDSIVNMNILFVKFKRDSYIYIWINVVMWLNCMCIVIVVKVCI